MMADSVDKADAWDAATSIPPKTYTVLIGCASSLAAAISLLERGGKSAAPSDKMFDQMLGDYRASLENARDLLKTHDHTQEATLSKTERVQTQD